MRPSGWAEALKSVTLCAVAVSFLFLCFSAFGWHAEFAAVPLEEDVLSLQESPSPEAPAPAPTPAPTESPKPLSPPEVREYDVPVRRGELRYVSQLNDVDSYGWGKYAGRAGSECTTACISMALSYLGIDASPEAILDYSLSTVLASTYGIEGIRASDLTCSMVSAEAGYEVFLQMMERYEKSRDAGVSPVLLYLSGAGHNHALVVFAEEGEDYLVLDPVPRGIHRIRISEEGRISTEEEDYLTRYSCSDAYPMQINSLAQWELEE